MALGEYLGLLGARRGSMTAVVELLPRDPTIVETGSIREEHNWQGDGQSTRIWDAVIAERGGRAFSVDIDPVAVELTQRLAPRVEVVCSDSVKYLSQLTLDSIDLLFLDSRDFGPGFDGEFAASLHAMHELCAAAHCRPKIVMVDDSIELNGHVVGKAAIAGDYLKKIGAQIVISDRCQVAWKLI